MNKIIQTKNADKTQEVGRELAHTMRGGEVLFLSGNLGAGKTTFMQGFAEGLGVTHRIISPTFIIMRKYEVNRHPELVLRYTQDGKLAESISGSHEIADYLDLIGDQVRNDSREIARYAQNDIRSLYHIDLYRTESEEDLESLGLKEVLQDKNAIVAIEWPEKLGNLLPEKRIEIKFETISEHERKISMLFQTSGTLAA